MLALQTLAFARFSNLSMDRMRSTHIIPCLFAAMFVMATSSHAETGDGGAAGIMATHTPVSSPATVSRTRKAISARPKMSDKAKLTRVAVERRVIRAAQNPAKPHVTASSSAPKLDKTAGVLRTAQKPAKLRVVTARSSQRPAKPRVETAHSSAPKLDKP